MAGFTDLVRACQPAYYDAGARGSGTEGASWDWKLADSVTGLGVTDGVGDPIDLSTATGVCKIYTAVGGTVVLTLTLSGDADGIIYLTAAAAATASLASGLERRECVWAATFTLGAQIAQLWSPANSAFTILASD